MRFLLRLLDVARRTGAESFDPRILAVRAALSAVVPVAPFPGTWLHSTTAHFCPAKQKAKQKALAARPFPGSRAIARP
jgi:hypothetical protein